MMTGTNSAGRLLSFLERIERLQEEIRTLQTDVSEIKKEAKGAGYDIKVIGQMLKERRMGAAERQEWQVLCETYRAALGMLDGTPLGDATRKRLMPDPDENEAPPPPPAGGNKARGGKGAAPPGASPPPSPPSADDLVAARQQGGSAAREDQKVTANPYAFNDTRRAAWDEGWCAETGSDGMDLPPAWRRTKAPKGDGKGVPA